MPGAGFQENVLCVRQGKMMTKNFQELSSVLRRHLFLAQLQSCQSVQYKPEQTVPKDATNGQIFGTKITSGNVEDTFLFG